MGTLFSALDIGRAGLLVAQVQLDVAGHNIANVNKEGFSRQRVEVSTRVPNYTPWGAIGRGPVITGVERLRESFLDQVYRKQVPGLGQATVESTYYARIEDIFQEPGETGFSSHLDDFFDSLNDYANSVEDQASRVALLSQAQALTGVLNDVAQRVRLLRTDANEEVRSQTEDINSLTQRIANLNVAVRDAELGGKTANDLRDDRDVLIDQLAGLVNITYREEDNGVVDILLGGDSLVTGGKARTLATVPDATIDPKRPDLLGVQFTDNGRAAFVSGGELYGALQIRDVATRDLGDRLDTLAQGLITAMNQIHSQSNGLVNITDPITSTTPTLNVFAPLGLSNLPSTIQDGSFDILVYDGSGSLVDTVHVPIITTGPLSGQTTPADLESTINGSAHLSALANADGLMTITPETGYSITFSSDTSGALAALGYNSFFTGLDAASIGINQQLIDNPSLLGSGYSQDPLDTGDNSAALDMAALRNAPILEGNSQTVSDYYQSIIVRVGINSKANQDNLSLQQSFVDDFSSRRQEVSGVSTDEEVTSLMQFQRAYEASARVITVADRMLETLVNLVG